MQLVVGGCSDPRNRRHIADGETTESECRVWTEHFAPTYVSCRCPGAGQPVKLASPLGRLLTSFWHRRRTAGFDEIQSQLSTFHRFSCGSSGSQLCVWTRPPAGKGSFLAPLTLEDPYAQLVPTPWTFPSRCSWEFSVQMCVIGVMLRLNTTFSIA